MTNFDRFEREAARLETNAFCIDSEALYGREEDEGEILDPRDFDPDDYEGDNL